MRSPGVRTTEARVIIAEIGLDTSRFPTSAHLASWARFVPGVKESAGRLTEAVIHERSCAPGPARVSLASGWRG
ncbi:MAG: transposase [Pseudonocardiaceae bacterium]